MNDSEIVDLYLSRDENAISETARKYGTKLRHIANSILDDMNAAEECENDTYLKAWELIPPNEPRTYFFAFLGNIIRHIAIDVCRKRTALKRDSLVCELTKEMEECIPGGSSAEESAEAAMLGRTINGFLGTLTETQRDIFIRRYWFFDTVSEISVRYGFSESKVKTTLFRIREQLRKHLKKEGYNV